MVGVRAQALRPAPAGGPPVGADGGDSPAWSQKRSRTCRGHRPRSTRTSCRTPSCTRTPTTASSTAPPPRGAARGGERLGLHALALTDHDGFYGIVRMAEAAEKHAVKTVFGAELSLGLSGPQNGEPTPRAATCSCSPAARRATTGWRGDHRRAARAAEGWPGRRREGPAGLRPRRARRRARRPGGVLTGCRKGARAAGARYGHGPSRPPRAGARPAGRPVRPRQRVVELFDHGDPLDTAANDVLSRSPAPGGCRSSPPATCTTRPRAAGTWRRRWRRCGRAAASTSSTAGCPASGRPSALRAEMRDPVRPLSRGGRTTVEIADEPGFPLRRAKPGLPKQEVPAGHTPMTLAGQLVVGCDPAEISRRRAATARASSASSRSSRRRTSPATS